MKDQEIIEVILSGEINQFEELMIRYNARFYKVAFSFLENPMDAEDAMQSAYLKIFEKLESFSGRSNLNTWMIRILINECKMILRKKKYKLGYLSNLSIKFKRKIMSQNSESILMTKELKRFIEQSILNLPNKYKVVYTMKEINGFSINEIASLLDLSENNVKVRIHRAKDLLKTTLMTANAKNDLFDFHLIRCNAFRARVMKQIKGITFSNN